MPISKNTAGQSISLLAIESATSIRVVGDAANITGQISIDGGSSAATGGTIAELDATDQKGIYILPLSQAETNGDIIVFTLVSSTDGVVLNPITVYTDGAPLKNTAAKVVVFAINVLTGLPVIGDALFITADIAIDGGSSIPTNDAIPTELNPTSHPGIYIFDMTAAEMNGDIISITPVSSSSNVEFDPLTIYTRVASGGGNVIVIED